MTRLDGKAQGAFLARVAEDSGQDLAACLQCGKCSGGCPITSAEVRGPRHLLAEILYGDERAALSDPTWWHCVACGTCMTRCPVEIDVARVAAALCALAERAGVTPSEPDIHLFEELFLRSVARHGRANELRVVAGFNLRTRRPFRDAAQGLALARKGAIGPRDLLRGGRADPRVARALASPPREEEEPGR